MLYNDVMAPTKRTIASAFGDQSSGGGKGKGSRQDKDTKHKCHDGVQIHTLGTRGKTSPNPRHSNNPNPDNEDEQVKSKISQAQILPIIQPLPGFACPPPLRDNPIRRDKSRFYEYHRDVEHKTNFGFRLNRLLSYLVNKEHLKEYVEDSGPKRSL